MPISFETEVPTATPTVTSTYITSATPTATARATPTASPTSTATATPTSTPAPARALLISEFLYDGIAPGGEGDEFVEIYNPLSIAVFLGGYRVGDEETPGGREGMYLLPLDARVEAGQVIVIAKNALAFRDRFGHYPDYEMALAGEDTIDVPNLARDADWGKGSWGLANDGDEILLLGPQGERLDAVVYGAGDFAAVAVEGKITAPESTSAQRLVGHDSDDMRLDFAIGDPTPGEILTQPQANVMPPAALPDGLFAYWGDLRGYSAFSDGWGPPRYAWSVARAHGLHFLALTEPSDVLDTATWSHLGQAANEESEANAFVALRGFEIGSVDGPDLAIYGTDTFPSVTEADTVRQWLLGHPEAIALLTTPDLLPFDPVLSATLVAYQIAQEAKGKYQRREAIYHDLLADGWQIAPAISGQPTRDWGSAALRTGIVAPALTETHLLNALRARRIFATEDANLALVLRGDTAWMGSRIEPGASLDLSLIYLDPDGETVTLELYDRDALLARETFSGRHEVNWTLPWVAAPGHYYHARAIQADGDMAWTAPLWVTGDVVPAAIRLNELLPAPKNVDWDSSGVVDKEDEWIELYNPGPVPVALGDWQLSDPTHTYAIPQGTLIGVGEFVVLYRRETQLALNNSGDTVTLSRPDGSVADTFTYDRYAGGDQSWSRTVDGAGVAVSQQRVIRSGPGSCR